MTHSTLCRRCRELGCLSSRREHDFGALKDALGLTPCRKSGKYGRTCRCLEFIPVPLEVVVDLEAA